MKILCKTREDILKDKAAYEEDKKKRQAEYDSQYNAYDNALNKIIAGIQASVEHELGNYADDVRIDVDISITNYIRIKVDNGDNPHDSHALSWSWEVRMNKDGEILKDSSSWSGLTAVTEEQIQDLRDTVSILEILNNIDWSMLLNVEVPDYKNFITMMNPLYEEPDRDYDLELKEVDIESILGDENAAIDIGYMFGDKYSKNRFYATILKSTPKRLTIYVFSEYYLNRWKSGEDVGYKQTVSKDKFFKYANTSNIVRR